jgi:endoglucanase
VWWFRHAGGVSSSALGDRPAVRINQLGYLSSGAKRATLLSSTTEPVGFRVVDTQERAVFSARSVPWPERPEPTSGQDVHVLDFSALPRRGIFRIVAADAVSHPFRVDDGLYASLAVDALRFFYLQRSGCAILENRAPGYGRPAGHVGVPPNTGDTAVGAWTGPDAERLYPGWTEGGRFDVSGGWYDAGDHGKYVTSGALPVWQLLATIELLRGHPNSAPVGLEAALLEEARWQLDWLLRMQVPPGHAYAGLAFHRVHGTEWAPDVMWPHRDPSTRVLHRPSTGAALHLAAAAARGARTFAAVDPAYAVRLREAARLAYRTAQQHPTLIAPDDGGVFGGGPYGDHDLSDDVFWAAVELGLSPDPPPGDPFPLDGFDVDRVAGPAHLTLGSTELVAHAARRLVAVQRAQPWGQPYAPVGPWPWGSNGRLLNNLMLLGYGYELTGEMEFRDAVLSGFDYLLGRNALGQSYVTGYGTDFSHHQRTRHYARDRDPTFPPPPPGAVAGGPTNRTYPGFPDDPQLPMLPPQQAYLDVSTSETTNDVCIRWNAPLVWAATFVTVTAADDHARPFSTSAAGPGQRLPPKRS